MAELILSSDTLDIGRQKINNFADSVVGVWSSDTTNYSIFSRIGPTNYNYSNGNYGLVAGSNNSGITGDYASFLGGKNNYSKANFNLIGNGIGNKIRNSISNYSSILNGKSNEIGQSTTSKYTTVLAGKNNKLYGGNYNIILNGSDNIVRGATNLILGRFNKISAPSNGPALNMIIGGNTNTDYNLISGTSNVFLNSIFGFKNKLNNMGTFGASTGFFNYNYIGGVNNEIVSANGGANSFHNFLKGSNLSTTTIAGGNNGAFNLIFGKGSGVATKLKPRNSYEVILGVTNNPSFRINFNNGKAYGTQGALTWQGTGADYGEYFEWLDKNINKENRTGYFVEIIGGKIQIARSEKVIGIVSKTTTFVGDSVQDYWSEMFIKDEWGEILKETYEVYHFNDNGNMKELYFDKNGICFEELPNSINMNGIINNQYKKEDGKFFINKDIGIINKNYNPSIEYIPRKDRTEWEVVGLLGKMRIRTSEKIIGDFVDVDTKTGMAKNGSKYPVMQKIKDFDGNYGIVLIFFK